MNKMTRIGLAAVALGGSLLGGVHASQAAVDDATATMGQESPLSIPDVQAHVYLNWWNGGLDVTFVQSGTTYSSNARIYCEDGNQTTLLRKNVNSANDGDITLYCNFGVAGDHVYGVITDVIQP